MTWSFERRVVERKRRSAGREKFLTNGVAFAIGDFREALDLEIEPAFVKSLKDRAGQIGDESIHKYLIVHA